MLAMHRLVLQLLAAMGEAVQQAMRTSRGAENSRGGDRDMVTVAVEEDEDDDVMWMQLPPVNDWWPLLQSFMEDMDRQIKTSQQCMAEWLLDWLSHRSTNELQGYFLGHMPGRPSDLTAALVTYAGNQCSDTWARCTDDEVRWCMAWAHKLQPHLELHPGSRQARGLAPQRAPIMLSPVPVPDFLLYDEAAPPEQTIHGDLPAGQLNQVLEVDSSGQEHSQVARDQAEVDYLAGLHTPTSQQPGCKHRAVLLELSSGSADVPSRVLRLPVPATGELALNLRIWTETEEDQEGIDTVLVGDPPRGSGEVVEDGACPGHAVAPASAELPPMGPGLVMQLAAMQPYDEGAIVAGYGWDVLRDVQVCRALAREGTQIDDSGGSVDAAPAGVDLAATGGSEVGVASGAGLMPRPSQEEDASSGASVFTQADPAQG